ncbi:MAG: hypothetical protein QW705_00275 [Zestosphaera sp.]
MGLGVRELGAESRHGIYRYAPDSDEWEYLDVQGLDPFIPHDKYSVIYFGNTKCSACRRYDIYWYPFVRGMCREGSGDFAFYVILCGWFAKDCNSVPASVTYMHFDVHSSPTTILTSWVDGRLAYKEKYEGVLSDVDLKTVVPTFPERVEKFLKGKPVKPPISKEDTLLSLINKLLKSEGDKDV